MRVITPPLRQALSRAQRIGNYNHEIIETSTTAYLIMEDAKAANAILRILNLIKSAERPQLIHNGRKPREKRPHRNTARRQR